MGTRQGGTNRLRTACPMLWLLFDSRFTGHVTYILIHRIRPVRDGLRVLSHGSSPNIILTTQLGKSGGLLFLVSRTRACLQALHSAEICTVHSPLTHQGCRWLWTALAVAPCLIPRSTVGASMTGERSEFPVGLPIGDIVL